MRLNLLICLSLCVFLLLVAFIWQAIIIFHPSLLSIFISIALHLIIFLLIRKKLVQLLTIDERETGNSVNNLKDKKKSVASPLNDESVKVNQETSVNDSIASRQNRQSLREFYKDHPTETPKQVNRNNFQSVAFINVGSASLGLGSRFLSFMMVFFINAYKKVEEHKSKFTAMNIFLKFKNIRNKIL